MTGRVIPFPTATLEEVDSALFVEELADLVARGLITVESIDDDDIRFELTPCGKAALHAGV